MPARAATRRYADPVAFWREYHAMLRKGSLLLSRDDLGGEEPATQMRVDLVVPGPGRVGPLVVQLVQRLPDGSAAFRVDETPPDVTAAVEAVRGIVEGVKKWLVDAKEVEILTPERERSRAAEASELLDLRGRVAATEARLAETEGKLAEAVALIGRLRADARRAPSVAPAPAEEEGEAPAFVPARAEEGAPGSRGRGFLLPDLADKAPRFSGHRDDGSLRDALMKLAVEKATGVLTLRYPDGLVRWGFWQKGGAVGWRAEPLQEQEVMGMLLYRANSITKEQLAESLEIMERRGIRQGDALIEMGLITFAQLVLILQKQCDFVLQKVLAEGEGEWTFHEVEEHRERFIPPPARVAATLFRALRSRARDMPADQLARDLAVNLDRYVYFAEGVERTLEEMRLTVEEQQFVKILRATSYRLRELSAVSNLSRSQTATMVWCLQTLGLVVFRAEEAEARSSGRIAKELLSRKTTAQRGTLFDRLELHWICTTDDVEAAWARMRQLYGPDHVDDFGPEWRSTMELIGQRMEEAYQRLRTDLGRREYRAEVFEPLMIEQSAAILAEKGEMAFMKANAREALDCYVRACELMPKREEYRQGLQRARAQGG